MREGKKNRTEDITRNRWKTSKKRTRNILCCTVQDTDKTAFQKENRIRKKQAACILYIIGRLIR